MFKAVLVLGLGVHLASATYAAAQQADLNWSDLILINGKILTMEASSSIDEVTVASNGKILAAGSSASFKALISQTRVFDAAGKTLFSD